MADNIGQLFLNEKMARSEYGEVGDEEYLESAIVTVFNDISNIKVTKSAPVVSQGLFFGISSLGIGSNLFGGSFFAGSEAIRVAEYRSIFDLSEEFTTTQYKDATSTGTWGTGGSVIFLGTGSFILTKNIIGSADYQLTNFDRIKVSVFTLGGSPLNNITGSVTMNGSDFVPITFNTENQITPTGSFIQVKINSLGLLLIDRMDILVKGSDY